MILLVKKLKKFLYIIINSSLKFSFIFFFQQLKSFIINKILYVIGIRIFKEITYPKTNISLLVKYHSNYWKRLEKGLIEFNCIKQLLKCVKNGQTILDTGAWIGSFTLLLSKLVGHKGKVISFEPDLKAFRILNENIEKNKLENVHAEPIGLSNFIGRSTFYLPGGGGTTYSSLILDKEKINLKADVKEYEIEINTIDNYCEKNKIIPDGIKIDVEGAEGLVIEGCQKTISKFSPWILLEFHNHLLPEKEKKIIWQNIINSAKKVIFIHENDNTEEYQYGDIIKEIPRARNFNIFIKY